MAFPFLTISSNTTTLNTGSFYSEKDLSTFNATQSIDNFFGKSEQDVIEFSVFDITGNSISSSILNKTDTYSVLNGNYKDVDENNLSYSYKQYNSDYLINLNRNILVDTLNDLIDVQIPSGSNVVSYNFTRNMAGDSKYNLIIKNISSDRKEVQLIPTFKLNLQNEENVLINLYYESFSRKSLLTKDVIDPIKSKLDNFRLTNSYTIAASTNQSSVALMKSIFGLKTDSDIIEFLNKIYIGFSIKHVQNDNTVVEDKYDGIKTYITNWLYTYYKNIVSVNDLKSQFQYIINTAVFKQLSIFNYNYAKLDTNNEVANFINVIFYDNFILPAMDDVNSIYQNKFYSYLKNALNFGNNTYVQILNHDFITDSNNNTILIVKLFDYLPSNINLRDTCWVSNISNVPIIQKVITSAPTIKKRHKISGPNFKIDINKNYKSKSVDYKNKNQLVDLSLSTQIDFNKKLQQINVDYTNFNNFVIFSSAQLRIKLFNNKLNQLNSWSASLSAIQISASNAAIQYNNGMIISASYQYDVNTIQTQIQNTYNSFDGFEAYLYNNQYIISGSAYNDYLNSAIDYDHYNRDSLSNNTPEYINNNEENSDYLVFLSMIGHFFDNLYIYIGNFPTNQYVQNSSSENYLNSIVNLMLQNFGWDPIDSTEISNLQDYYLNKTENPTSENLSQSDKIRTIWNRILNNLPYLYKTKGTAECIKVLSNIYGIPQNLVNISEYGSNSMSDNDNSTYTFDQKYYFTNYNGKTEYINLPISSDFKSLEFKFNFLNYDLYKQLDNISLVQNENLKVYIIKDIDQKFGKLYFQLSDQTIRTDSLPFFNGEYFSVLIKEEPQSTTISQSANFYKLKVASANQNRIMFEGNSEMLLSYDYHSYFTGSNQLTFGNLTSDNKFYGTLDKINVWNSVLNDDAFYDHCKNFDSYNDYDLNNTYGNLYFRYSFDYPIDLSSTSSFANYNKYYSQLTGSCFNFLPNSSSIINCVTQSISSYPYQFKEVDMLQNLNYRNFGPNTFKQPKINKINQSAVARLMTNESSTTATSVSNNSNLVGVYVSPYSTKNADIINFLGNYNIMDLIGDPANVYKNSYDGLMTLREEYNKNNLAEQILYQEFFTLYKGYFDSSFFESVKKLIPARSKLFTGILIDSSVIERNKYENKPIDSTNIGILDFSFNKSLYNLESNLISVNTASLNSNTPIQVKIFYDINKTTYISNEKVDKRFSSFSKNGVYSTITNENGFVNYYIYKNIDAKYDLNRQITNSELTYVTGSSISYNFTLSDSLFPSINLDTDMYPVGYYSLLRNATNRKLIVNSGSYTGFLTTSNNTVNISGSLDGSSPVTLTSVRNQTSTTNLVTI